MRLHAEGPAVVTAGMISEAAGVEIMNPDHVLCHVDKGGSLSMELTVDLARAMYRLPRTVQKMRPLVLFQLMRFTALFARLPIRWKMNGSDRLPTLINYC